ncbi:MAG: hypothetical protein ACJARX_000206, partial [Psychroserpens sp.]
SQQHNLISAFLAKIIFNFAKMVLDNKDYKPAI